LLFGSFGWWLRHEYRCAPPVLRRWLGPGLAWRLLLTTSGIIFPSPDAVCLSAFAHRLTTEFWRTPGNISAIWDNLYVPGVGKYALSNTYFFVKLLSVLNVASFSLLWLNTLYLSLFCFAGCWVLTRVWVQAFPATPPGAAIVALLLWPSVTWWTAGLGKETLLVGSETLLVALALQASYGPPASPQSGSRRRLIIKLLVALPIAWLAYRMRYFFALPLLGGLLVLALVRLMARRGWLVSHAAQTAALLGLLLLGGGLGLRVAVGQVSEGFYSYQFYEQYSKGIALSAGRPHLVYAHLAPTAASLLRHAPEAVGHVLLRPWFGEATQPLYLGAALENAGLLVLLGLAGMAVARGRSGQLPAPVVVLLLLYCLVIAAFIGLSTPNLGTLHRYRAALLPWLLLLLLQNDYARRLLRPLTGESKT